MDSSLQKKILPLLHYSLKPGGLLLLGSSEEVGESIVDRFVPVNRKWKIFRAQERSRLEQNQYFSLTPGTIRTEFMANAENGRAKSAQAPPRERRKTTREGGLRELVEKTIMEEYAPPSILVDENNTIIFFHGDTGRFLVPPRGEPTFQLSGMVLGPLSDILPEMLQRARMDKRRLVRKDLHLPHAGGFIQADIVAKPVPAAGQGCVMITFEEQTKTAEADGEGDDARVIALQRELYATRQDLQAVIEELETANEELQSANEELQANNEELQSTNEELETSREELQSTNEELETVNSELKMKNDELIRTNDDINNIFGATDIGTVILDMELRIKRFTPAATHFFRLIPSDKGRPLDDIVTTLRYEELTEDMHEVLETLHTVVKEIPSRDGQWYSVHLLPYRTSGNVIGGVVITFTDITALKEAELAARAAGEFTDSILTNLREPLLVLDKDLRVVRANRAFYQYFRVLPEDAEGTPVFELGKGEWDIPELHRLLLEIIPHDSEFQDFRVSHDFPSLGPRTLLLNARRFEQDGDRPPLILLAFEDITEMESTQDARK